MHRIMQHEILTIFSLSVSILLGYIYNRLLRYIKSGTVLAKKLHNKHNPNKNRL